MNSNAVIDVALGLILMYLLLSLVCTMLNEFVAGVLALRAKTLAKGITNLIDDDYLLRTFREHGIIAAQSSAAGGRPSYLSGGAVAAALVDSLDPTKPVTAVSEVVDAASKLPPSKVRDAILTAATTSGNDLDKLRTVVAGWFDDAMDRLSGVYKRYLQWLSLVVGLGLAVILNADTLAVAGSLWRDAGLRSEIASSAAQLAPKNLTDMTGNLKQAEDELRPFPLGWSSASNWPGSAGALLPKLVGLILTGLALSLGAPFWFDLLIKFVNLRATGVKPDPVGRA